MVIRIPVVNTVNNNLKNEKVDIQSIEVVLNQFNLKILFFIEKLK